MQVRKHRTPLHRLLAKYKDISPGGIESIEVSSRGPKWKPFFTTAIASNKEQAKEMLAQNRAGIHVYTDGSGFGNGIGAAAVLIREGQQPKSLQFHLGKASRQVVYGGETVGLLLGAELLRRESEPFSSVRFCTDNQAAIQVSRNYRPGPGRFIMEWFRSTLAKARRKNDDFSCQITWAPGHCGPARQGPAGASAQEKGLVPIKTFVHEVLRRSRTTCSVLQSALCYVEAIRSKVPELVEAEKRGQRVRGEWETGETIVKADEDAWDLETLTDTDNICSGVPTEPALDPMATLTMNSTYTELEIGTSEAPGQEDTFKRKKMPSKPLPPLPPLPSPLLCPRRTFLAADTRIKILARPMLLEPRVGETLWSATTRSGSVRGRAREAVIGEQNYHFAGWWKHHRIGRLGHQEIF
jgi:ribonuclease HI